MPHSRVGYALLSHPSRSTYSPPTSFSSTGISQQRSRSPDVWLELAAEYSVDEGGPDVWMELVAEYAAKDNASNKPVLKSAAAVRTSVVNSFVPFVSNDCLNPYTREVMNVACLQQLPTISESDIRDDISNSRPKEVQNRLDRFCITRDCEKAEEQLKENSLAENPIITAEQDLEHTAICPSRRRWREIRGEISSITRKEIQDNKERQLRPGQQCTCKAKELRITRERITEHAALCPSRLRWKDIRDELFSKTPKSIQDKQERVRIERSCNCKKAKKPEIVSAYTLKHRPLCPSRRLLRDIWNGIFSKNTHSIQDKLERIRIEGTCICKNSKEPVIALA